MGKKTRRRIGDVVAIALKDGSFAFGRVLMEPLMAFYALRAERIPTLTDIVSSNIAFKVCVMNYAITHGDWPVLGNIPLEKSLTAEPLFFKRDSITGALSIYRDSTGEEVPATAEECAGLECAAVWEPEHVLDRLEDFFAGRPNKWVKSLAPRRKGGP